MSATPAGLLPSSVEVLRLWCCHTLPHCGLQIPLLSGKLMLSFSTGYIVSQNKRFFTFKKLTWRCGFILTLFLFGFKEFDMNRFYSVYIESHCLGVNLIHKFTASILENSEDWLSDSNRDLWLQEFFCRRNVKPAYGLKKFCIWTVMFACAEFRWIQLMCCYHVCCCTWSTF